MLDPYDPAKEEMDRLMWEKFYEEHPDADPIKIMCATVCMIWLCGMAMCAVLLVIAGVAWFCGVL